MRGEVKSAIAETIEGLMKIDVKPSFTEKELKELGVEIPQVDLSPNQIKAVRAQHKLSQAVFAKVLNVSPSANGNKARANPAVPRRFCWNCSFAIPKFWITGYQISVSARCSTSRSWSNRGR